MILVFSQDDIIRGVLSDLVRNFIWISIRDPESEKLEFKSPFCLGVLYLDFDDLKCYCDGAKMFCDDDARRIWEFVRGFSDVDVVINCVKGQNRSAAVAVVLSEVLLGPGSGDQYKRFPYAPNSLVFRLLMENR